MSIIKETIKESSGLLTKLTDLKNAMLVEIKNGDMSLYPKYIEVCTDVLTLTRDIAALKA